MKDLEPRLYSYKMTHVTGKAPRVYENELVLPACKPDLRKNIQSGHWMAGWTSKGLDNSEKDKERLVYLALVDSKISLEEFHACWINKPTCVPILVEKLCCDGGCPPEEEEDENAPVVICKEFYYFGAEKALEVQPDVPRPRIPEYHDRYGWKTEGEDADRFIGFVRKHVAECVKSNKN